MVRSENMVIQRRPSVASVRDTIVTLSCLVCFAIAVHAGFSAGSIPAKPHLVHYTVQSGETLWKIVERLDPDANPNATVDWVMAHNPGFYGDVHTGQVITVPEEVK